MSSNVTGAIIGAAAVLAAVALGWLGQRWLEARRHRNELVATAITDVLSRALAEGRHGDPRTALALFSEAKVRLVTYAPREVIGALLELQRAGQDLESRAGRAAFVKLVRCARAALLGKRVLIIGKEKWVPSSADVQALLFGFPSPSNARSKPSQPSDDA